MNKGIAQIERLMIRAVRVAKAAAWEFPGEPLAYHFVPPEEQISHLYLIDNVGAQWDKGASA